jgi:poly [ADP-ribose] polymerase 6/8
MEISLPSCIANSNDSKKLASWNEVHSFCEENRIQIEYNEFEQHLNFQNNEFSIDLSDWSSGLLMVFDGEDIDVYESQETLKELVQKIVNKHSGVISTKVGKLKKSYSMLLNDEIADDDDKLLEKNKFLMAEINNVKRLFGEKSVSIYPIHSLRVFKVHLKIFPLEILKKQVALAWEILVDFPLEIILQINYETYPFISHPPQVEVVQFDGENKKKTKIGIQVKNLLELFLQFHWRAISSEDYKVTEIKDQKIEDFLKVTTFDKKSNNKDEKSKIVIDLCDDEKKKNKNSDYDVDENMLDQLLSMGFDYDYVESVLTYVSDMDEAIDILSSEDDERCLKPNNTKKKKTNQTPSGDAVFKNSGLVVVAEKPEDKMKTNLQYGMLPAVVYYVKSRLPRLNAYCVICDKPHVFSAFGNMLKPAVCTRELCCWGFQQLGVGSDMAGEIAVESEVVDLLVSLTKFALKNIQRRELVFDQFPILRNPQNNDEVILGPNNKNWTLFEKLVAEIPSVQEMSQADDFNSMKTEMNKTHGQNVFTLLSWIISSNRSHIVRLNSQCLIEEMGTSFQFLLLSDSPEKEEKFQSYKKQYKTTFAFHGSPIANWHGILRKGLVNASGTKIQMHGAAHGSGIYLSQHGAVSHGYSMGMGMGRINPTAPVTNKGNNLEDRFLDCSGNLGCIAICEIIDKDIKKSGNIWVHPHEDMVCTRYVSNPLSFHLPILGSHKFRFLFVYSNIQAAQKLSSILTTSIEDKLNKALQFYT